MVGAAAPKRLRVKASIADLRGKLCGDKTFGVMDLLSTAN
jgi:hypothetical protein